MKICVVGDSHAGALKVGWDRIKPQFGELDITFVANPRRYMNDWGVEEGAIVPGPEACAALSAAQLAGSRIQPIFDYYLICGLDFGTHQCVRMFQEFRLVQMPKDERAPISADCTQATFRAVLSDSLAAQWIRKIDAIAEAPKGIIPVPMTPQDIRKDRLRVTVSRKTEELIREIFDQAATDVANELCARLFPQSDDTLTSPLITDVRYGRGDSVHMNWDFGELMLKQILQSILAETDPGTRIPRLVN